MKSKRNEILMKLIFCSIMASFAIVLDKYLGFPKGNYFLKFTLYGLPLMFTGIMFGKIYGLFSGLISGIVLQLTSDWGISITSIFWALPPIAWGFVSGLLSDLFKKNLNIIKIIIIVGASSISALLLNTFAMVMEGVIFNDPNYTSAKILTELPPRIISMLILWIAYTFVLKILYNSLKDKFIKNNQEEIDDIED